MASNYTRRSNSSGSRNSSSSRRSSSSRSSRTVKGRPSQGNSLRMSSSRSRTRTSSRSQRVSHTAWREVQPASRSTRDRSSSRAQQGEPLRSVSVSQVRDAKRRKRRGVSFPAVFVVILVLAAIVGIGGFALYNSNLFSVTKVTVSGAEHLTADEMTQLAAVPDGTTLIRVDTDGITNRLKSNAWVKDAVVERIFPDTLNLNITERSISAVVDVTLDDGGTTQRWALASDGTWLMAIPDQDSEEGQKLAGKIYEDVNNALYISHVPYGTVPEAGKQCSDANIQNALSIIDGLSTELADQVKAVTAASSDSTTLTLDNGIEVAFGDSSNLRDKERICLQLMEEYPGQIAYINVRDTNSPIWRSL